MVCVQALQESIRQTSKGDTDEDRDIDQAIRASIANLQRQMTRGELPGVGPNGDADDDDEQLRLAIAESLKDSRHDPSVFSDQQETGVLRPPEIPPKTPRRSISPYPRSPS